MLEPSSTWGEAGAVAVAWVVLVVLEGPVLEVVVVVLGRVVVVVLGRVVVVVERLVVVEETAG